MVGCGLDATSCNSERRTPPGMAHPQQQPAKWGRAGAGTAVPGRAGAGNPEVQICSHREICWESLGQAGSSLGLVHHHPSPDFGDGYGLAHLRPTSFLSRSGTPSCTYTLLCPANSHSQKLSCAALALREPEAREALEVALRDMGASSSKGARPSATAPQAPRPSAPEEALEPPPAQPPAAVAAPRDVNDDAGQVGRFGGQRASSRRGATRREPSSLGSSDLARPVADGVLPGLAVIEQHRCWFGLAFPPGLPRGGIDIDGPPQHREAG